MTNGLGGYASGTIGWSATRRYHGLLIAALAAPLGRVMMFNHLAEELWLADGQVLRLAESALCRAGGADGSIVLSEFRLEDGLPVWDYRAGPYRLERRIVMPYRSNTVHVGYRLLSGSVPATIRLRPYLHFRPHDAAVSAPASQPYPVTACGDRFEVAAAETPPLRLHLFGPGAALVLDGGRFHEVEYALERARGYDYLGTLWSPGFFRADLAQHVPVALAHRPNRGRLLWRSSLGPPGIRNWSGGSGW